MIFENRKNGSWPLALSSWPENATPNPHRRGRRCHTILIEPHANQYPYAWKLRQSGMVWDDYRSSLRQSGM